MDLFDKFQTVEIRASSRISQEDKDCCERHQAAYESALRSYAELLRVSMHLEEIRTKLPGGCRTYLLSERDVNINEYSVRNHLEDLQERFVDNIVRYFCDAYAVSIPCWNINRALEEHDKDDIEGSTGETQELPEKTPIRYESVVDLIFKEMDGRSFEEYAMYQLKNDCQEAIGVRGGYYERRKAVLCFRGNFCYAMYRERYGYDNVEWNLNDNSKAILKALAHFETGKFADYPGPIARLVTNGTSNSELMEFYDCKKLEELKLFKNGRMDIRFASPALADAFEEAYLRREA